MKPFLSPIFNSYSYAAVSLFPLCTQFELSLFNFSSVVPYLSFSFFFSSLFGFFSFPVPFTHTCLLFSPSPYYLFHVSWSVSLCVMAFPLFFSYCIPLFHSCSSLISMCFLNYYPNGSKQDTLKLKNK